MERSNCGQTPSRKRANKCTCHIAINPRLRPVFQEVFVFFNWLLCVLLSELDGSPCYRRRLHKTETFLKGSVCREITCCFSVFALIGSMLCWSDSSPSVLPGHGDVTAPLSPICGLLLNFQPVVCHLL